MSSEALFIQDSMGGFDEYGTPNFIKNTKNFYDNYEDLQVFLDARGIEFLVHFTDSRNIPSIWKYGMLSRKHLDELRFT